MKLRTPITTILAAAEDGAAPGLEDKSGELLNMIEQTARRLAGMVEQLLTAAKLETNLDVWPSVPVDLAMVARAAAGERRHRRTPRDRHAPLSAFVMGDADSLRRVVDNLNRAATLSSTGVPRLDVTVEVDEYGDASAGIYGGEVVLSVVDHGPASTPGRRDRIFDRFNVWRAPSRRPAWGWGCRSCVAWCYCEGRKSWWRTRRAAARPSQAFPLRVPQREA